MAPGKRPLATLSPSSSSRPIATKKSKQPLQVEQLPNDTYILDDNKISLTRRNDAFLAMAQKRDTQKANFLGYQANQNLDYCDDFKEYLNCHLNNIGDPFISGNFTLNTKEVEKAVLEYYARLWGLQQSTTKREYWGYVLSMGCSEGNLCALWNGRDYLSGKLLNPHPKMSDHCIRVDPKPINGTSNAFQPVAFYSDDTHYSIIKFMQVLQIPTFYDLGTKLGECPLTSEDYPQGYPVPQKGTWPREVPSHFRDPETQSPSFSKRDGSIYIPALVKLVDFFSARGYPVLINFNYGSTFKGAYDQVHDAVKQLIPVLKKNNMYKREFLDQDECVVTRDGYWIHVDGALGAAYMPYLEKAKYAVPQFDFRHKTGEKPMIHSIAMSGHKWIGCPWPTGIYMTLPEYQLKPPDDPEYIGSPDTTFAGSRNGLSPFILWDYLAKRSILDHQNKAIRLIKLAEYAYAELRNKVVKRFDAEVFKKHNKHIWIERTDLSLTVRFMKPVRAIVAKYSLSAEGIHEGGEKRKYGHIFMMDHVTRELIDQFIEDIIDYQLNHGGAFYPVEEC